MSDEILGHLFVSYSHLDKPFMLKFRKHLKGMLLGRMQVWSDEDIARGATWESLLEGNLAQANAAVVLATPDYLRLALVPQGAPGTGRRVPRTPPAQPVLGPAPAVRMAALRAGGVPVDGPEQRARDHRAARRRAAREGDPPVLRSDSDRDRPLDHAGGQAARVRAPPAAGRRGASRADRGGGPACGPVLDRVSRVDRIDRCRDQGPEAAAPGADEQGLHGRRAGPDARRRPVVRPDPQDLPGRAGRGEADDHRVGLSEPERAPVALPRAEEAGSDREGGAAAPPDFGSACGPPRRRRRRRSRERGRQGGVEVHPRAVHARRHLLRPAGRASPDARLRRVELPLARARLARVRRLGRPRCRGLRRAGAVFAGRPARHAEDRPVHAGAPRSGAARGAIPGQDTRGEIGRTAGLLGGSRGVRERRLETRARAAVEHHRQAARARPREEVGQHAGGRAQAAGVWRRKAGHSRSACSWRQRTATPTAGFA